MNDELLILFGFAMGFIVCFVFLTLMIKEVEPPSSLYYELYKECSSELKRLKEKKND